MSFGCLEMKQSLRWIINRLIKTGGSEQILRAADASGESRLYGISLLRDDTRGFRAIDFSHAVDVGLHGLGQSARGLRSSVGRYTEARVLSKPVLRHPHKFTPSIIYSPRRFIVGNKTVNRKCERRTSTERVWLSIGVADPD
jgi:hypothetical protein